jgi:hypothetical protein
VVVARVSVGARERTSVEINTHRAEGAEVLRSLGDGLSVESHDDAAGILPVDGDVEEDLGGEEDLCVDGCQVPFLMTRCDRSI